MEFCQVCTVREDHGHDAHCSVPPPEVRIAALERLVEHYRQWVDRESKRAFHERFQARLWQGKYAIVKAENNALRRKLYRKEKQEKVDAAG